jgi:hypothetical protein
MFNLTSYEAVRVSFKSSQAGVSAEINTLAVIARAGVQVGYLILPPQAVNASLFFR